jgi:outer membrane protein OmpA-like peptidoglycan-associated protein
VQSLTAGSDDDDSGLGWLWWLLALGLLLFAAWWFFMRGPSEDAASTPATTTEAAALGSDAAGAATALAAAPAEGTAVIPTGAGVTTEMRDGQPVVKVYFDSGKVDIVPAFGATAGGLKEYLAANPGAKLAISGYADPSGNAAQNAELAKQRAQAVQAGLVQAGIPEASAALVKPENVADATVAKDAARRVEVVVVK